MKKVNSLQRSDYISRSQVNSLLLRHLPCQGQFIDSFMSESGHGIPHGRKVFRIANEQLDLGAKKIGKEESKSLQWACLIHDIADIKDAQEYKDVFSAYKADRASIAPLFHGLNKSVETSVDSELAAFDTALTTNGKLRPYHHLTAAVFAYKALAVVLGTEGAKLTAQAILLHSGRNSDQFSDNMTINLLRDADKIEGLNIKRLIEVNARFGRVFFDPGISFDLRVEIIRDRKRPEDQEAREKGLKLDTFQFAGIRSLILDTNPAFYANPQMSGLYLQHHGMFNRFLNDVISSARNLNKDSEVFKSNLAELSRAFEFASTLPEYSSVKAQLLAGKARVEKIRTRNSI